MFRLVAFAAFVASAHALTCKVQQAGDAKWGPDCSKNGTDDDNKDMELSDKTCLVTNVGGSPGESTSGCFPKAYMYPDMPEDLTKPGCSRNGKEGKINCWCTTDDCNTQDWAQTFSSTWPFPKMCYQGSGGEGLEAKCSETEKYKTDAAQHGQIGSQEEGWSFPRCNGRSLSNMCVENNKHSGQGDGCGELSDEDSCKAYQPRLREASDSYDGSTSHCRWVAKIDQAAKTTACETDDMCTFFADWGSWRDSETGKECHSSSCCTGSAATEDERPCEDRGETNSEHDCIAGTMGKCTGTATDAGMSGMYAGTDCSTRSAVACLEPGNGCTYEGGSGCSWSGEQSGQCRNSEKHDTLKAAWENKTGVECEKRMRSGCLENDNGFGDDSKCTENKDSTTCVAVDTGCDHRGVCSGPDVVVSRCAENTQTLGDVECDRFQDEASCKSHVQEDPRSYDECVDHVCERNTHQWPDGWGSNAAADIAHIENSTVASAIVDCVCRHCSTYEEVQNWPANNAQPDQPEIACKVAARVTNTDADFSYSYDGSTNDCVWYQTPGRQCNERDSRDDCTTDGAEGSPPTGCTYKTQCCQWIEPEADIVKACAETGAGSELDYCEYSMPVAGPPGKALIGEGFNRNLFKEGGTFEDKCAMVASFRDGKGSGTALGVDAADMVGTACKDTSAWEEIGEHIGHDATSIAEYCENMIPEASAMAALKQHSPGDIIAAAKAGEFATLMPGLADNIFIVTSKPEYGECLFTAQGSDWGAAICTCDTPSCNNYSALEFIVDADKGPMRLLQFIDGSLVGYRTDINAVVSGLVTADGKIDTTVADSVTESNVDAIMNISGLSDLTTKDEIWGLLKDFKALSAGIAAGPVDMAGGARGNSGGNSGTVGPSWASPSAAPLIQQTVDYEVEGTLATMTVTEQTTTKTNARKAFVDASATITDDDVDKVTLAQKTASSGRERRTTDILVVTITLKSNIDKSTATAAAAKEVEFEVVANGKKTPVTTSGTAKEVTLPRAAAAPSALPQLVAVVLGTLLVLA